MKTITVREMAAIKRAAMDVAPLSVKKAKIASKIMELGNELKALDSQIEARQSYVKMTTGYTTEDLVVRTVSPYMNEDGTQKTDKDGRGLTITKYEPNSAMLTFDEKKRVYVVNETEAAEAPEVAEEMPVEEMPFGVEL